MDIVLIRAVVLRLPEPLGVAARVKVTAFWSKFSAPHVHDFKAAGPPSRYVCMQPGCGASVRVVHE
jgi:hypothetical protein